MVYRLKKGKTLLVDGPARVQILSGRVSVLGAQISQGVLVVRRGKRMPIEALCDAEVELTMSEHASSLEIAERSVPTLWKDAAGAILSRKERKTILVIGGVDSGKTSFCTYLANSALALGYSVALLDSDLGQSDVGPPGTLSLVTIKEPVYDLFKLRPEELFFVGVTSPSAKVSTILKAVAILKDRSLEKGANLIIVNTDGWVDGEEAINYKVELVKVVHPEYVIVIKTADELKQRVSNLENVKVLFVDPPENIKKRDRETRKILRESAYKKYLRDAKIRSFPLAWVKIHGGAEFDWLAEEKSGKIRNKEDRLSVSSTEAEGLLVALKDAGDTVLGIGIICQVDCEKSLVKIWTPVKGTVSTIELGQIRLDKEGNEVDII